MKRNAIAILFLIGIISAFAAAQAVSAPDSVEITQSNKEFKTTVANGFEGEQPVNIKLISPVGYNVEPAVFSLQGYSSKEFRIRLLPTKDQGLQTVNATLLVSVGSAEERQNIEIKLGDFSKKQEGSGTGLAVLPSLDSIDAGTVVDVILIAIIVILVIALFARIANRKRGQ